MKKNQILGTLAIAKTLSRSEYLQLLNEILDFSQEVGFIDDASGEIILDSKSNTMLPSIKEDTKKITLIQYIDFVVGKIIENEVYVSARHISTKVFEDYGLSYPRIDIWFDKNISRLVPASSIAIPGRLMNVFRAVYQSHMNLVEQEKLAEEKRQRRLAPCTFVINRDNCTRFELICLFSQEFNKSMDLSFFDSMTNTAFDVQNIDSSDSNLDNTHMVTEIKIKDKLVGFIKNTEVYVVRNQLSSTAMKNYYYGDNSKRIRNDTELIGTTNAYKLLETQLNQQGYFRNLLTRMGKYTPKSVTRKKDMSTFD